MSIYEILNNSKILLKEVDAILSEHSLQLEKKEIVLRRCFTESWFSDTLAWLLNPKGSHNLGVKFGNEFLKTIAKTRSNNPKIKSRANMLKWGKSGKGASSTKFSLKNASSIREFYLAQSIRKRNSRGARYCDVVFLDLDLSDGLFLVIENKLFTSNHDGQLEEYYDLTEDKFKRAKIREYVYLTLYGVPPFDYGYESPKLKYWVCMSWSNDILSILNKLSKENGHSGISQVKGILEWLDTLKKLSITKLVNDLRKLLLAAATACLLEELIRLGKGKSGEWEIRKPNTHHITLNHSSSKKKPLYVELLPNFTITVQSRKKGSPLFEKIIVPFGVNSDQIFNLIFIAARDIYYFHFGDSVNLYLSNKRRLSSTFSDERKRLKHVFNYAYEHQHELKIILASSKHVQEAQEYELSTMNSE